IKPHVTLKSILASAAELPLDHINKSFGIVYITLMRVTDTIVSAAGLWSWVSKSMSYLIKLASILWRVLPTQSANRQFPKTSEPADQGWFPDKNIPMNIQYSFKCTETYTMLKDKGTVKFYYINELSFVFSMHNAYSYEFKGANDGVS
ncbi:hypothetical protein DSO57_1018874, partial [Entomophthora muscae]